MSPTIDIRAMGSLCILLSIARGNPVVAYGDIPAAMVGAKWADVYSWRVFFWRDGGLYCCRKDLKSEDGQPWSLEGVARHFGEYPELWVQLL